MSQATDFNEPQILSMLIGILERMTSDWDLDESCPIGPPTLLIADLGFESLDVVEFAMQVRDAVRRPDLPFEELLVVDERYVEDVSVGQVVEFVCRACAAPSEIFFETKQSTANQGLAGGSE